MKRPTTLLKRPTTIPARPTTVKEFDHKGFSDVMQAAYKGIHEGPMIVYRTEDGLFHVALLSEWVKAPVGKAVAQVTKTSRGMRIGPA